MVIASERWAPVPGFEGRYEASDMGRVRSLDRIIETRNGSRWKPGEPGVPGIRRLKGRVLKPGRLGSAHLHVVLEGGVDRTVHSLVLDSFVGPCPPGMMARHLNDDPSDNRLENLCWGTRSENSHDAVANGHHWQVNKTHCARGHEFSGDNLIVTDRRRACRECANRRNRGYTARKRALHLNEFVDGAAGEGDSDSCEP